MGPGSRLLPHEHTISKLIQIAHDDLIAFDNARLDLDPIIFEQPKLNKCFAGDSFLDDENGIRIADGPDCPDRDHYRGFRFRLRDTNRCELARFKQTVNILYLSLDRQRSRGRVQAR